MADLRTLTVAGVALVVGGVAGWLIPRSTTNIDATAPPAASDPTPFTPAAGAMYHVRLNLVDPNPGGGGPFQQPTQLDAPHGKNAQAPASMQMNEPPGPITTIRVSPGTGEPLHTHGGGLSGTGHCHWWVEVNETWYQLHCQ